jgi:hypothetical protein
MDFKKTDFRRQTLITNGRNFIEAPP